MTRFLSYIFLPREITKFEREYLRRINRIARGFFLLHLPVLVGVAALCGTGPRLAAALCTLTLIGPMTAYHALRNPRHVSLVFGITSMFMGGLLVHFGQGSMQIEMHFYFFVSLALMAVFANPSIIVASAISIALHHLVLYLVLPRSVFNYQASVWAVVVHALFVVLESIAACFVARQFFDNVIGLEKIVDKRTEELDIKNRDLHLLLDNVNQGFMTATRDGLLASEHSRAVKDWFGPVTPGARIWEYFGAVSPEFGTELKAGWENLQDGIIPVSDVLSVLPKRMTIGARHLQVQYQSIPTTEGVLVVLSDVTAELERERAEEEQRELIQVFEGITNDRAGFLEFFNEARTLTDLITENSLAQPPVIEIYRAVHTLKGNASLFGLSSLAGVCHGVEERLKTDPQLGLVDRATIRESWNCAAVKIERFLSPQSSSQVEIDTDEYRDFTSAVRSGVDRSALLRMIESWKDEPVRRRFARIADQVKDLAERIGKGPVDVVLDAAPLRLPQGKWVEFWSALVHTIRNAVDHGIEAKDERVAAGKPSQGVVTLSLSRMDDELCIKIADDGRGIDWEAVREKARAHGLPAVTREHLIEAVFTDGISTKDVVTEISGQGVGMGAVRAACHKMKGTVILNSERGFGTQVEFRFPLSSKPLSPARFLAPSGDLIDALRVKRPPKSENPR